MSILGDLIVSRGGSVNPASFADEEFELYSIPAHDRGGPDFVRGAAIGSSKQIVEPGDVLISKIIPHIRRARVVSRRTARRQIASGEWIVFRGDTFDPSYLKHFLLSDGFHQQFMNTVAGVGGSLVRARPQLVKTIPVPLPHLDEQRRIAAILDQADALRAKRRQVLADLEALTQSIFHSTIEGASWPVEKLGERLEFLTSGSRGWAKYYAPSGAKFIRIQNVRDGYLNQDDMAYVAAPPTAEAKRTAVQQGDVLLSITADLGRTAVVPDNIGAAYINQHLAILRAPSLDPRYLADFLSSPAGQREVLGKDRGATKAGLNFDNVRSVAVPIPPREIQRSYSSKVARINTQRATVERALAADERLFVSLQSHAFRGEL